MAEARAPGRVIVLQEVAVTPAPVAKPDLVTGEHEVEGQIYVGLLRAAELRGTANLKTIQSTACAQKWRRIRAPNDGRQPLYLKEDVLATAKRSKAA